MIDKNEVIEFFDKCAPKWDADMIRNDDVINKILDNAGVTKGSRVLDVACGTGVLIPDYMSRNVSGVTAIDISPEMIKIAKDKFENTSNAISDNTNNNTNCNEKTKSNTDSDNKEHTDIRIICGDVYETEVGNDYDSVIIYNAFPHFTDPDKLIQLLAGKLVKGGRITVAHGMSREKIDAHHRGSASKVSNGLMEADKLADIFAKYTKVITVISDDDMYQVVGETY